MFCKNCDNKIKKEAKFCSKCGGKVSVTKDKKLDTKSKSFLEGVNTRVAFVLGFLMIFIGIILYRNEFWRLFF